MRNGKSKRKLASAIPSSPAIDAVAAIDDVITATAEKKDSASAATRATVDKSSDDDTRYYFMSNLQTCHITFCAK